MQTDGADKTPVMYGKIPDEVRLLSAWSGGDPKAGKALFELHAPRLTRYFRTRVAAAHVEDLVHDTFLRCHDVAYRGEGSVRAFLFGIAYRRLLEHFREQSRSEPAGDGQIFERCAADFCSDPEYVLGQKTDQRLLLKAMRRIRLDYQTVLEMSRWQGLKQHEIGHILGRPAATIGRWKSEAVAALRQQMEALATSPELRQVSTWTIAVWQDWLKKSRQDVVREDPA